MSCDSPAQATFLWGLGAHGVVVCHARGDIDLTSRADIEHAFARAAERARTGIVVDLSGVGFCDSTGLNALLALRVDALRKGLRLLLAGPPPQLVRLLQVVGADLLLPVYPSVREALARLDGGEAADGGAAAQRPF